MTLTVSGASLIAQLAKNLPTMQETRVQSLGQEDLLEKELANGNPLQYSCLENPMRRGAWEAIVHGVTRFGHDLATIPPPWACFTVVSVIKRASLVAQMVMSQPAIQET